MSYHLFPLFVLILLIQNYLRTAYGTVINEGPTIDCYITTQFELHNSLSSTLKK